MLSIKRRTFLKLLAGGLAAADGRAFAQRLDYPTHPVRLVIPFPPGGAYDAVGRPWAERMKSMLGDVVVENVTGGSGSIGAASVAHARGDGYTLLLGGTLPHVNEVLLKSSPLYDPVKDLDPIAAIAANVLCIAVHPSIPVKTLAELVDYAKKHPGVLAYGHAGLGSIQHLTGELFKSAAGGLDIVQVPYRGTGPVVTDLIGGQVPVAVPGITRQVLDLHRAGRMRILAVTTEERIAAAPELPTAAESGFPSLVARGSIGVLAPAGTPPAIIDRIAKATRAAAAQPAWQRALIDAGIEPVTDSGPQHFRRWLASDLAHWEPVIRSLALKIE